MELIRSGNGVVLRDGNGYRGQQGQIHRESNPIGKPMNISGIISRNANQVASKNRAILMLR